MVLVLTFCLVVAAYIFNYVWHRRRIFAISNKLYGPKPWPIIGNGHLFIGSSESKSTFFLSDIINLSLLL
jgi:fermentation-respiration switch protein FrsA (DUF1100 family)